MLMLKFLNFGFMKNFLGWRLMEVMTYKDKPAAVMRNWLDHIQ